MVGRYFLEDATVEAMVTLTGDENSLNFIGRYIVDYRRRRYTKDRIFTRIFEEIDASNGAVRIAGAAIDITAIPPITIRQPS